MEKKERDYIFLLAFMILSYLSIAVGDKIFLPDPNPFDLVNILKALTVVGWYIFLYRIMTNFYSNKLIRWGYIFLMVFHFLLTSYVHRNDAQAVDDSIVPATISYVSSLIGFGIVFYNILKDVFTGKHNLRYSLLGASNIYFMIPLMFCYVYSLMSIQEPANVHADPANVKSILFNSFNYSWFVIAGMDYTAGKIGDVIQSMAVMEAIAGNLFIVFIIGRLMSRPGE